MQFASVLHTWSINALALCLPFVIGLAAPGPAHADTARNPELRVTIIPDANWSPEEPESETDFTCPTGKVLIGRKRHTGIDDDSDENDPTQHLCGTPMQYGEPIKVEDAKWSDEYDEHDHVYIAPHSQFITGRYHHGDEEEPTKYKHARAVNARGEPVWVKMEGGWHEFEEGEGPTFLCPANTTMIGRKHTGDENGWTGYVCGSLWGGAQRDPTGTLVFRDEEQKTCELKIPNVPAGATWTYSFQSAWSACADDAVDSMSMYTVPSAVRILLSQDELCLKDEAWVELLTKDKSTTIEPSSIVQLQELFNFPNNRIVRPGLLKIDHGGTGNGLSKKLSCVRITNSPEPATLPTN
jgi:hypothetical protein